MQFVGPTPLAVARLDFDGDVVRCNDAFAELMGSDRAAIEGKVNIVRDMTLPADAETTRERFRRLRDEPTRYISTQKEIVLLNGRKKFIEVLAIDVGGEFILDVLADCSRDEIETIKARLEVSQREAFMLLQLNEQLQSVLENSMRQGLTVKTQVQTGGNQNTGSGNSITTATNQSRVMLGFFSVLIALIMGIAFWAYYIRGDSNLETPSIPQTEVTGDGSGN